MDAPSDLDTREGLISLMQTLQVPAPLQDALINSGIACIADFAYAYSDASDLNSFIAKQPDALWEGMQITDPEHSPAVARRALDRCKSYASTLEAGSAPAPAPASQHACCKQRLGRARTAPLGLRSSPTHASKLPSQLPGRAPGRRWHAQHSPAQPGAPVVHP